MVREVYALSSDLVRYSNYPFRDVMAIRERVSLRVSREVLT